VIILSGPDQRPEQRIDLRREQSPHLDVVDDHIVFRSAREDAFAAFREAFGSTGSTHGAKAGWRAERR